MSDVPEYSYRSKDVLYEAYLPSWATRPKELNLELVNPDDKNDEVQVDVRGLDTEPTMEVLEKLAVDRQSYLDEPSTTLWTGEIDGRPAVRRTTTGLFSWFRDDEKEPFLDDSLLVGLPQCHGGFEAGVMRRVAEAGSPAAKLDLLNIVSPVCKMPSTVSAVSAGTDVYQIRGFGVSISDSWKCSLGGVGETHDYGPLRPSHWGYDEHTPGYKVKWYLSDLVRDLDSEIRSTRRDYGIEPSGHGSTRLALPPVPGGTIVADYLIVDVPAVEHEQVIAWDMHGKEVLVDHRADRYAHRLVVAWFSLGRNRGCEIAIRVENEVLERWEPLWLDLVSAIRVGLG